MRPASALGWGGRGGRRCSDDPACKTTAAKFAKCLEFTKCLASPALSCPHESKAASCAGVEVQSPPATSVPETVNKRLFSYNVLSSHAQFVLYSSLLIYRDCFLTTELYGVPSRTVTCNLVVMRHSRCHLIYFTHPSGREPAENVWKGEVGHYLEGGWSNILSISVRGDISRASPPNGEPRCRV